MGYEGKSDYIIIIKRFSSLQLHSNGKNLLNSVKKLKPQIRQLKLDQMDIQIICIDLQ